MERRETSREEQNDKSPAYRARKSKLAFNDSTRSSPRPKNGKGTCEDAGESRLVVALMTCKPLMPGMSIPLASVDLVNIGRGTMNLAMPRDRTFGLMIDDNEMSRLHAKISRIVNAWIIEDMNSKNGTFVNGDPVRRVLLNEGDLIELGSTAFIFREAGSDLNESSAEGSCEDVTNEGDRAPFFPTFLLDLERHLHRLARVCASDVPILVRGETGTGKELIARAVHEHSGRDGKFVDINCGALPQALIESELFGYLRGAFTGASAARLGLVRAAHGGTLFLDEIGDLPRAAQTTLLRVLQERSVMPLGSTERVPVDIRIVAATNRPLENMIETGEFRRDLYARLAGFEVTLPPLRKRREDIGLLIAAILGKIGMEAAKTTIDRPAARALLGYDYPANVRELEQALRSAVPLAQGGRIGLEHLPEVIRRYRWSAAERSPSGERETLLTALQKTRGDIDETGRVLRKAPAQIRRMCREFDIDLNSFRRPGPK